MPAAFHFLYGFPPADLAAFPAGARQVSPLVPGSSPLEDLAPDSQASGTLLAPPGTLERRYTLALALRSLAAGGTLTALAPKDKGGSRLGKELREFGAIAEEESKRHHRICRVTKTALENAALEAAIRQGEPRFDEKLGAWTQPGTFAWDRVDQGSALLLAKLPPLRGRGIDLGAGLGYLSRAVLRAGPQVKHLDLVEIDRRSVEAARRNVDPARSTVHWADVRALPKSFGRLDFAVTNPPFHDGGQEDQSLGQAFLEMTAELLAPGGEAWIVANRHLPYEGVLRDRFTRHELLTEAQGFKIFRAIK